MKKALHLALKLDFAVYLQNRVHIEIRCRSEQKSHQFQLEALAIDKGLRVVDFQVTDPENQAIQFTKDGKFIYIPAADFRIVYNIETDYADCVGADMDIELVYPFMNRDEVFLGSGILAHPSPLRDLEAEIQATLEIENAPPDWSLLSNFIGDTLSPATLDGFFIYAASQVAIDKHTYTGQEKSIKFQLMMQRGKTIPYTAQDIWGYVDHCLNWIETHLAPYRQADEINILMLQAPPDFGDIAKRPTFASGENFLNGIVTYGPDGPRYFQRLFGYGDYKTFLLDGIAHELMHTYTTTSWQGKYKAVLVPTAKCPPNHARLIGEGLNQYFHRQILYRYLDGSTERFFTEMLLQTLNRQQQRGRKEALLDLFLFDAYLRERDCSLMVLYRAMVKEKQRDRTPYQSGEWMLDVLGDELGIQVSDMYRELLLGNDVPDYVGLMAVGLGQFGYELEEIEGDMRIVPHGFAGFSFDVS